METRENFGRKCPKCGSTTNQMNSGFTRAKSRRVLCWHCKCKYTPDPKKWAYTEEERKDALRLMSLGMSGRKIGAYKKMHHDNAYRWSREMAKKGALPFGQAH